MVCICQGHLETMSALLTASTTVFIPSSDPFAQRLGHRQCAPVTIPQTELPRRTERDYTYEFACKVIHSRHTTRHTTQNGLPIAREGLTFRP